MKPIAVEVQVFRRPAGAWGIYERRYRGGFVSPETIALTLCRHRHKRPDTAIECGRRQMRVARRAA